MGTWSWAIGMKKTEPSTCCVVCGSISTCLHTSTPTTIHATYHTTLHISIMNFVYTSIHSIGDLREHIVLGLARIRIAH